MLYNYRNKVVFNNDAVNQKKIVLSCSEYGLTVKTVKTAPVQNDPTSDQNGPNSRLKRPHNKTNRRLGRCKPKVGLFRTGAV